MQIDSGSASIFRQLWVENTGHYVWVLLMGFLVAASSGWVGHFLMLRRLSFLGDSVSHSILPGVVLVFLCVSSYAIGPLMLGACLAGALSIFLSGLIAQKTPLKADASLGIVFPIFFALGVVLLTAWAGSTDLDLDCILYGELAFIPFKPWASVGAQAWVPWPVLRMGIVFASLLILTRLFYKELLLLCFDPTQVRALMLPHRSLQGLGLLILCTVTLFSFEAVGSLLGVAMLIFPPSTARLLSKKLPTMLKISCVLALLYALGGLHLAAYWEASVAAGMVTTALVLFLASWGLHVGLRAWEVRLKTRDDFACKS